MSPFDRAHTSSDSTLIESMWLSCIVFDIERAVCRKSPILTYPTCIWRPRWGDPGGISLGVWKLESLGYHVVLFAWSYYTNKFAKSTEGGKFAVSFWRPSAQKLSASGEFCSTLTHRPGALPLDPAGCSAPRPMARTPALAMCHLYTLEVVWFVFLQTYHCLFAMR